MNLITLNEKEMDRIAVISLVLEGKLSQAEASKRLKICERQVRRLQRAYEQNGPKGLMSKKRGKRSNNRISDDIRIKVLNLIRTKYSDFKPTLTSEMLEIHHGIKLSSETVRQLMIENRLWKPKRQKNPRIHQSRHRRPRYGELIQIDGSPHAWLEDRGPRCCLLGFIDDATSRIQYLRFVVSESTESYFEALGSYIEDHGRPEALYSDKHSVFRVNKHGEGYKGDGITQFGRAAQELGIDLICANTPQAKGRVERMFSTLQDRLVKELRIAGIASIDEANAYLVGYIERHNAKFAVEAKEAGDCHQPLLRSQDLNEILCIKEQRKLSKNLEFSFEGTLYQVITDKPLYSMRKAMIEIHLKRNNQIHAYYKGKEVKIRRLATRSHQGQVLDRKSLLVTRRPPRGASACQVAALRL